MTAQVCFRILEVSGIWDSNSPILLQIFCVTKQWLLSLSVLQFPMKRLEQYQYFPELIQNLLHQNPPGCLLQRQHFGPHHKIKTLEWCPEICILAKTPVDSETPGSFSESGPDSSLQSLFHL